MTTLCRVSFCARCAKEGRPKTLQLCLFYGSARNGYFVRNAIRIGNPGFTPHIIRLVKSANGEVVYEKICGMNGCGTEIYWVNNERTYKFNLVVPWERGIATLKDWNFWVKYKHDPDYDI